MSRLSDLFIHKVKEYSGKPVVINDWCHYITFDVMGDLAFGRSYGQLESGRLHQGVAMIGQWLSLAQLVLQVPWAMCIMQQIPVEGPEEILRKFATASLRERERVSTKSKKVSRTIELTAMLPVCRKSRSSQTSCRISSKAGMKRPGGRLTGEL
jgi:hypothetical protein